MAVEFHWEDDEHTILHLRFGGSWTWEEFYPIHQEVEALARERPYTVYTLIDLRDSQGNVPPNALTHLKNIASRRGKNAGLSILVTTNRFIMTLYQSGVGVDEDFAAYFRLVGSIEAAYDVIADAKIAEAGYEP